MAVSAETKLLKAKQRIAALLQQIDAGRTKRAILTATVRRVVASSNNLERNLAGAHGVITKLEQQLIRAGLTPVTQVK